MGSSTNTIRNNGVGIMIEGQEVTVYFEQNKTIEGVGIVKKVHQLLFDNEYALVTLEFKTGLDKGELANRIVKNQ